MRGGGEGMISGIDAVNAFCVRTTKGIEIERNVEQSSMSKLSLNIRIFHDLILF